MQRSYSTPAVVVSVKPSGENNSSVTLITPEKGIVYSTLYGGPKSKMRSLVSLWNSGIIYLYENPEKNQIKISDFDVKNYHPSFSQNLYKMYAASLAAEIVIKSRCAGSNEASWKLFNGFLDGLELSTEEQGRVGLVRFLWRYLELLGIQPDACECGYCGKSFLNGEFATGEKTYYNNLENNFTCRECSENLSADSKQNLRTFPINAEAVRYLAAISALTPAQVRRMQISEESYNQMKNIVFFLIENSIETKLNTIETGIGIL
ncbi:MAG: DNA repair protein RecO [Treponema sp.]|nr:DNA repair protein RecO [Treponema sp.]